MVEVGQVGVEMSPRVVRMSVGVADPRRQRRVRVIVVSVVVAVGMDVLEGLVRVLVLVSLGVDQPQCGQHQGRSTRLDPDDRLAQQRPRQGNPPERSKPEEHL